MRKERGNSPQKGEVEKNHLMTNEGATQFPGDVSVDFGDGHSIVVERHSNAGDPVTHALNLHGEGHGEPEGKEL